MSIMNEGWIIVLWACSAHECEVFILPHKVTVPIRGQCCMTRTRIYRKTVTNRTRRKTISARKKYKKVHNICSSMSKFCLSKFCLIIWNFWLISKFIHIISNFWLVVFTAKLCWTICQTLAKEKKRFKSTLICIELSLVYVKNSWMIITPNFEIITQNYPQDNRKLFQCFHRIEKREIAHRIFFLYVWQ